MIDKEAIIEELLKPDEYEQVTQLLETLDGLRSKLTTLQRADPDSRSLQKSSLHLAKVLRFLSHRKSYLDLNELPF